MARVLSTWPFILFAILEPFSEIAGWYLAFVDPTQSVAWQHPNVSMPETLPTGSETVARQLGNMYLLMAMMGVAILSCTSEPKVVRNYLIALAIGDLGHLYVTYLGCGWSYFIEILQWNAMAWGNIGITSFLLLNRLAYFLGMFGDAKAAPIGKKAQ